MKDPQMKFSCYVVVERHPGDIFTWVSAHGFKSEAVEVASKGANRLVVEGDILAARPLPWQLPKSVTNTRAKQTLAQVSPEPGRESPASPENRVCILCKTDPRAEGSDLCASCLPLDNS